MKKIVIGTVPDPNEIREAPKFVTRHLANTLISHVDVEAVSYLGYLPQDMMGQSILDFYHPDDLPLIKEIYESGKGHRLSIIN